MELFKRRFPHYDLKAHPERGTVLFQHDTKTAYSPEELLAMILQGWSKRLAIGCVITRICFFWFQERLHTQPRVHFFDHLCTARGQDC